jgi:hypothetical protein
MAIERWYYIDDKLKNLMLHTEFDGAPFLRMRARGQSITDKVVDLSGLNDHELARCVSDLIPGRSANGLNRPQMLALVQGMIDRPLTTPDSSVNS